VGRSERSAGATGAASVALCLWRTLLPTTLPQQKVFQDVLPFPGSERLVADPACYRINAFRGTRLNFDDLVKRKTAFAAKKWNCVRIRHVTPTSLLSPGANHASMYNGRATDRREDQPAFSQRAAASAVSSGHVLKAIAACGAALCTALITASNSDRLGGRRMPAPITTQS
jgi:hypothetical protein